MEGSIMTFMDWWTVAIVAYFGLICLALIIAAGVGR